MPAVPIKPEYGPTLGRMLSPRWRAGSSLMRGMVLAVVAGLVLLAVAAFLTLENAHYSRGGATPFSFSYRGLYKVEPETGSYVRLERHSSDGRLLDSFAVRPLRIPPYVGGQTGALALYAESYIRRLRSRDADFVLYGEGKTRVNTVPAYEVLYTATVQGQTMWGRDVQLLAQQPGAREGVDIVMQTTPTADPQVTTPLEVASDGVLLKPLKTFSLE